jgi:eukaryotic-like serine/threonine-protein kinase
MKRELQPIASRLCKTKGWTLGDFLGAGATAATFEVSTSEGLRALKVYAPNFLKGRGGQQVRRRFSLVVDNLKGHGCPNLIAVDEGGEFKNTLYMLMQRAPGHCLAKVLKSVPPGNIRAIVRQVATAAKFLEETLPLQGRVKEITSAVS